MSSDKVSKLAKRIDKEINNEEDYNKLPDDDELKFAFEKLAVYMSTDNPTLAEINAAVWDSGWVYVSGTDTNLCVGHDSIRIKVHTLEPIKYVINPTLIDENYNTVSLSGNRLIYWVLPFTFETKISSYRGLMHYSVYTFYHVLFNLKLRKRMDVYFT